jgi:hypothetical protein
LHLKLIFTVSLTPTTRVTCLGWNTVAAKVKPETQTMYGKSTPTLATLSVYFCTIRNKPPTQVRHNNELTTQVGGCQQLEDFQAILRKK